MSLTLKGSGTQAEPYLIYDQAGLQEIQDNLAGINGFAGVYFSVENDIVLNDKWAGLGSPEIKSAESNSPYVSGGTGFAGTLDCGGHVITLHRTANNVSGVGGLINYLAPAGVVKNLTLFGTLTVVGSVDAVGGVVGYNSGTIDTVTNQVVVTAIDAFNVGGVCGFNNGCYGLDGKKATGTDAPKGAIQHCMNHAAVQGDRKVGGITGEDAGIIAACANEDTISSDYDSKNGIGGIAGRNGDNNLATEAGVITNCYNTGDIIDSQGSWIGGITGFNNVISSISNCYNIGKLVGRSYLDNTAGQNDKNKQTGEQGKIENTYGPEGDNGAQHYDKTKLWSVAEMTTGTKLADALNGVSGTAWQQTPGQYPTLKDCGNTPITVDPDAFVVNVVRNPNVVTYVTGENFSITGLEVQAIYEVGTRVDVSLANAKFPTEKLADGTKEVTVTVTYDGTSYPLTITVQVGTASTGKVVLGSGKLGCYGTLDGAINAAGAGGTVYVAGTLDIPNGHYGGSGVVTFQRDDGFEDSLFTVSAGADVSLKNMVLQGSSAGNTASLIDVTGGTLTLDSTVTLENNSIPSGSGWEAQELARGGAVRIQGGVVNCDATVQNCQTAKGGAFFVYDATLNLTGGSITKCMATEGSAVYVESGTLKIAGVSITGNGSAKTDGTIYIAYSEAVEKNSQVTMTDGKISGNTAAQGAGVYLDSGIFTLDPASGAAFELSDTVYLAEGEYITVAAAIPSNITVECETPAVDLVIAKGGNNYSLSATDKDHIKYSNGSFGVRLNTRSNTITLSAISKS